MDFKDLIKKGNELGIDLSGLEEVHPVAAMGFSLVACTMMYLSFCTKKQSKLATSVTNTTNAQKVSATKMKPKKKKKSKKSKKKSAKAVEVAETTTITTTPEPVVVKKEIIEKTLMPVAVEETPTAVVVEEEEAVVVKPAAPEKKKRIRKKKKKTNTSTTTTEAKPEWVTPPVVVSASPTTDVATTTTTNTTSKDADDGWVVVKKSTSREERQQEKKLAAEEALRTAATYDVTATSGDGDAKTGEASYLPATITHEMDLRDCVALAFGHGGLNIRRIQDESGARIDVPKGQSMCTISGTPSSVALAVNELQQILDENDTVTIDLASAKGIGAIVGKGGVNIRRIESESGANVNITRGSFDCTITGNTGQLFKARALIAEYLEYGGPKPAYTETMTLEKREIFLIIGNAGATIRSIECSTDCRLTLEGNTLTMSGELSAVDAAQDLVHSIIHENSYEVIIRLGEDRAVLGAVIGKAGANIQKVQRETGARCDRKNDEFLGNILVIVGTEPACKKAEAIFKKIIAVETGPPVPSKGEILEEIELGSSVGSVIGRAGSTVNNIQKESGAVVQVKTGTKCYVVGNPEAVEKAVKLIEAILEKQRVFDEKREAAAAARAAAELAGNSEEKVWNSGDNNPNTEISNPSWESPNPVVEDTWSGLATDADGW